MTRQRSFKRLVRARMDKTGESFTAARMTLLAAAEPEQPAFPTAEETIRQRTGRGWEEWFDLLDDWGAAARSHREIARWIAEQQGIDPLAWNAQAITMSYERARRGRVIGQRADGFAITASRIVAVPVERLFDAFMDGPARELHQRTATRPRSARFDSGDGESRIHVTFYAKVAEKSTVTVEHARLADAAQAETAKTSWRERLGALKAQLERGTIDA